MGRRWPSTSQGERPGIDPPPHSSQFSSVQSPSCVREVLSINSKTLGTEQRMEAARNPGSRRPGRGCVAVLPARVPGARPEFTPSQMLSACAESDSFQGHPTPAWYSGHWGVAMGGSHSTDYILRLSAFNSMNSTVPFEN